MESCTVGSKSHSKPQSRQQSASRASEYCFRTTSWGNLASSTKIKRPSHRVTGNRNDGVKGIGAEFLHIAIDDHWRIAFTAMYPHQTESSATHFLYSALVWNARLNIGIQRILTDNGPGYTARDFERACGRIGLKHRRTRPCTSRTNGKAERFIQTGLRE